MNFDSILYSVSKMAYRKVLCKYYTKGYCHHGDKCTFLHDMRESEEKNVIVIVAEIDQHGEPWLNRSFGKIVGINLPFLSSSSNSYVKTLDYLILKGYNIQSTDILNGKRVLVHLVMDKSDMNSSSSIQDHDYRKSRFEMNKEKSTYQNGRVTNRKEGYYQGSKSQRLTMNDEREDRKSKRENHVGPNEFVRDANEDDEDNSNIHSFYKARSNSR